MLLVMLALGCERPVLKGDGNSDAPFVDERATLTVTVEAEGGVPLPGAWVSLDPGGRDARTGEDGQAVLSGIEEGEYSLRAAAEGYEPAETTATVSEDNATAEIVLSAWPAPLATLQGLVLHPDGSLLQGAQVYIDGELRAETDAEGAWEVGDLEGGTYALVIEGPETSSLGSWSSPEIEVEAGAGAELVVSLPGGAPAGARFVGSTVCMVCHEEAGDRWAESAHARVSRTPAEAALDLPDLAASFAAGTTVDLGAAEVELGQDAGGWWARLVDADGDATANLSVVEVYGGHNTGAAFAVQVGDTLALLPAAWALPGQGLSSLQHPAGWVAAWTDGWFDETGNFRVDPGTAPASEASWDLQCAGCHATGHALEEEGGGIYNLVPAPDTLEIERVVGCEACHGRGGDHSTATEDRLATILNPERLPSWQKVEVCARCHERTEPDVHPFSDAPGWPVTPTGEALPPQVLLADYATPAPLRWLDVEASKVAWDQVGDFRLSPHHSGPDGYLGACEDCHDPHGSEHEADLHTDPFDNDLCTTCHFLDFPTEETEHEHSGHESFHPGQWTPGACTSCHMPRMAILLRPDAVSGAGELRSHSLWFAEPAESLAEFDAAGMTTLPLGEVPVPACLDCHLQADAAAEEAGSACPCPVGNPERRATYVDFQEIVDALWGGEP